ncbi:MAG TPA: TonB-dependent receptor [Gemmatimonadales bacterium]|nr:TonB-dependent receptor [Gemmatimonadales bacterium]
MSQRVVFALLTLAGAMYPKTAAGQRPVELAFADPQPHFVASWAPKKAREAERSAVLMQRVSLELADVPLDLALKTLTQAAGLNITYSPAVLPAGRRVTVKAGDIAVVTALTEMLFRSGLDVVVDRDGALALVVCRHPAPRAEILDSGTIVGAVTDKATEAPIAGAIVSVEGTRKSEITNGEGRYRIAGLVPGIRTVHARYIGYAPGSVEVLVPEGGEVTADLALVKSTQKLDELVTVTPGGMQTQAKALPTPVTIITADEIAAQHPLALSDVIRQAVPSAVAFYSPGVPVVTNLVVRGASSIAGSSAMKIFVDGVEAVNSGLAPVDPTSIDRIEVIRGPQAATVYGADAAGGVVQIFTNRGGLPSRRPRIDLRAEGGVVQTPYAESRTVSRQQYAGSVQGQAAEGAVSYNFGGSHTRMPDWVPPGELSRQESWNATGGVRYTSRLFSADLHARYYPGTYGVASNPEMLETGLAFFSRPNFQRQDFANETYGARLTLAPTGWWQTALTLGADRLSARITQVRRRLTTPEDTLFFLFSSGQRKNSLSLNTAVNGVVTSDLGGSITLGVDHYGASTNSFFTAQALDTAGPILTEPPGALSENYVTIENTGYYAQGELGWRDAVFLTAGVRAEMNSSFGQDYGTIALPRIGVAGNYRFGATAFKVRLSYGRAIRAPLPLQAVGGSGPFSITLPNPLLAPERQHGWDAGIDLIGTTSSLSITFYSQVADNLVSSVQIAELPLPTDQYQNVGRVLNRGLELEAEINPVSSVRVKAQYGYVDSEIQRLAPGLSPGARLQVGDRPALTPTHTAGASVAVRLFPGTSLAAGLTYIGSYRANDDLGQFRCFGGTAPCRPTSRDYVIEYPGFERVTLAVTQRIARQLDGVLTVNNLTNNTAFEGSNQLPVMGRTTMLGLHFHH